MIRILLLHGWMHSTDRYKRLKYDLEDLLPEAEVVLWEFAGFGGCRGEASIQEYVASVCSYLMFKKVDVIIGHSMGALVALQAVHECDYYGKLVLISPPYGGLRKFQFVLPISSGIPVMLKLSQKCVLLKPFIWLSIMLTVSHSYQIDRLLWDDFYRADSEVASSLLLELITGVWRITRTLVNETLIIVGDKDRVIPYKGVKKLCRYFEDVKLCVLTDTGHTPIIETYNELVLLLHNSVS